MAFEPRVINGGTRDLEFCERYRGAVNRVKSEKEKSSNDSWRIVATNLNLPYSEDIVLKILRFLNEIDADDIKSGIEEDPLVINNRSQHLPDNDLEMNTFRRRLISIVEQIGPAIDPAVRQ